MMHTNTTSGQLVNIQASCQNRLFSRSRAFTVQARGSVEDDADDPEAVTSIFLDRIEVTLSRELEPTLLEELPCSIRTTLGQSTVCSFWEQKLDKVVALPSTQVPRRLCYTATSSCKTRPADKLGDETCSRSIRRSKAVISSAPESTSQRPQTPREHRPPSALQISWCTEPVTS
eukprot:6471754-Amphidinium_carterae.1